jgi:hypothetical protein
MTWIYDMNVKGGLLQGYQWEGEGRREVDWEVTMTEVHDMLSCK